MPVVSVSLSEVGYEGYKELPKGRRSRMIDRMLRDYALDHHHMPTSMGRKSVREIGEMQVNLKAMIASLQKENKKLKEASLVCNVSNMWTHKGTKIQHST